MRMCIRPFRCLNEQVTSLFHRSKSLLAACDLITSMLAKVTMMQKMMMKMEEKQLKDWRACLMARTPMRLIVIARKGARKHGEFRWDVPPSVQPLSPTLRRCLALNDNGDNPTKPPQDSMHNVLIWEFAPEFLSKHMKWRGNTISVQTLTSEDAFCQFMKC